jgi:DNA-binding MarR family transcriptional regulator
MSKSLRIRREAGRITEDVSADMAGGKGAANVELGGLAELIGYALKRTQLAVYQDFQRTFAELNIRPVQYAIISVIGYNPGLKQSQLSTALEIKRANIVALLDELEERDLATRSPVTADRRSYALHLTEKGMALLKKLQEISVEEERRLSSRIGQKGRDELLALLRGVREAADQSDQ